jgi:hypothetical protein
MMEVTGSDSLAYYDAVLFTAVKKFYSSGPGCLISRWLMTFKLPISTERTFVLKTDV